MNNPDKTGGKKELPFMKVDGVRCAKCGRYHAIVDMTFVTVAGAILVGIQKKIVGDDIVDNTIKTTVIFCRDRCFREALGDSLEPARVIGCRTGAVDLMPVRDRVPTL